MSRDGNVIRYQRSSVGLALAMTLLMALTLGTAQTAAAQAIQMPPVQLPPGGCTAAQLSAGFVSAQGAAGTLFDTLQLTNVSTSSCILNGFVTVQLLDAGNAPLPTVNMPGGGMLSGFPGPSSFVLPPGASSQFVLAWSDVPVGSETSCPAASHLALTPPGASAAVILDIPPPAVAPCNGGTVYTSALRPPGVPAP